MATELQKVVAIAIRRNKFERNGRLKSFDETMITEEELQEAQAAIDAYHEYIKRNS